MRTIFVEKYKKEIKVVDYILKNFPLLSKSFLFKALRNKDIRVNDIKITQNIYVSNNDKIDIYITDEILFNLPKKLNYIYIDDNILVVFKPQGILSNNEDKNIVLNEPTLYDLVKKDYDNVILCHRLDRNTAGLVIFARNSTSYNEVLKAFSLNQISKTYITYVYRANFKKNSDVLENYILIDRKDGISKIFETKVPNSQKIYTKYEVIYTNKEKDYSILKVTIHNGKTHQIRAQLSKISHPIIGDSKYGINSVNKRFNTNKQMLFAVQYLFNFNNNSPLFYLNNTVIQDKELYKEYIGSEFYEKRSKI